MALALADGLGVVPVSALAVPAAVVPTAGRWSAEGTGLRFTPRFPFAAGSSYALVRRRAPGPDGTAWQEMARLRLPPADRPPTTTVVTVHPTAAEVPENLLRLSVTFSAPMEDGSAADRLHLLDEHGAELDHALLAMPPELWDRPRLRLTLLLEPGRIKRGLVPHTALGPPLVAGREVTLVVGPGIRDAAGSALVTGVRRTYRVGPAVRSRVDPGRWRTRWPAAGTREPLVVDFERPLDHALALRCLQVVGPDGRRVPGLATLGPGEVTWSLVPDGPWPPGPWELHVDTALEDLAGNSVRRVFDRDLRRSADDPLAARTVVLGSGPDGGRRAVVGG